MLHLMMTACFKDVVETNEVTLYISIRICYATEFVGTSRKLFLLISIVETELHFV